MFDTVVLNRFWNKVDKITPNGCWQWTAAVRKDGYGHFKVKDKNFKSHRFSLLANNVSIPEDHVVCHSCDNPKCVNPSHLFVGTHNQNSRDMVNKNRSLKGEKNVKAKLTKEQVEYIKQVGCKVRGKSNTKILATQFNVSRDTILSILGNKNWNHVKVNQLP